MKRLKVLMGSILLFGMASNAQINSVNSSLAENGISFLDGAKAGLTYSFGQSSNVAKLSKEVAGAYHLVNPTLSLDASTSDSFSYSINLGAELKKYTEEEAQQLGDETNIEMRILSIWFLNDSWELGGDIGGYKAKGKLPVQLTSTETTSQDQEYFEPDARLYVSWIGEALTIEAGASASSRDFGTTVIDRGNVFYDNYELYGFDLKVGREFGNQLSLATKAAMTTRQYKERPADFANGAPSLAASPLPPVEENSSEVSVVAEYKFGKLKLTTIPSFKLNDDRVFGARDSRTLKIQQKLNVPVTARINWTPSFIYADEKFDQFKSDPESSPLSSPLRVDSLTTITSSLSYTLNKSVVGNIDYGFSNKKSNYAGSSYEEQTIAAGIAASL